jgi:hypothetical protein
MTGNPPETGLIGRSTQAREAQQAVSLSGKHWDECHRIIDDHQIRRRFGEQGKCGITVVGLEYLVSECLKRLHEELSNIRIVNDDENHRRHGRDRRVALLALDRRGLDFVEARQQ